MHADLNYEHKRPYITIIRTKCKQQQPQNINSDQIHLKKDIKK